MVKAVVKISFEEVHVWYLKAKTFATLKYELRREKRCVANMSVIKFRKKTAWAELETGLKVFTIFLKINIRFVLSLLSRFMKKLIAE